MTPQLESDGRRIDLVVTGAAGKLAVECDGDAFHSSPEQFMNDLHREQELKRCGWTFERIRGSEYTLEPEWALAPVWATLDRLGIGSLREYAGGTLTPVQSVEDRSAQIANAILTSLVRQGALVPPGAGPRGVLRPAGGLTDPGSARLVGRSIRRPAWCAVRGVQRARL